MGKNYDEKHEIGLEKISESDENEVVGGTENKPVAKYGGPKPKLEHPLFIKPLSKPDSRIMYGCPEPNIRPVKKPTEPLAPPADDNEMPKE